MTLQRLASLAFALALALPARPALAQGPANPHGNLAVGCSNCHRPDAWKPASISASFRHAEAVFPLDGAHARTTCLACHRSLDFSRAPVACASCHTDIHNGELGTQCARCHTTRGFTDLARMRTAHEATRFPLRGAHAAAQCAACHAAAQPGQMQFAGRPTACVACHAENYRATTAPDHQAARFSQECTACHGLSSWAGARFDHSTTRFPLEGGHAAVACNACHADRVYVGKPTACATCHMAGYNQATPPHTGFPTTCTTCHTTATWTGAPYDHSTTQFPLTGAHRTVVCASCHGNGVYRGLPAACVSCHRRSFDASTLPPHSALGFSTVCTTCHTDIAWQPARFDHATTQFALTGGHQAVACQACHGDRVYRGKPTTCVSCHQGNYDRTTSPPHRAGNFSTSCTNCHTTAAWLGSPFDHSTTQFPLTGGHRTVPCASCHADGVYDGKPTTCATCHQANYTATRNPPHAASGFPTTCQNCHTTAAWLGSPFNHATTQFPLTGAHAAVVCASCHGDGVYHGRSTACISCHQANYNAAAIPPHSSLGFPTVCSTCHTNVSWKPGTFDHGTTRFALTGGHRAASCADCHADRVYRGKPMTCVTCHQAKYAATRTPPHAASGFPTTCETCHTTTAWLGSPFDHATTRFPLTGAHRAASCTSCHGDGVYRGKSMLCSTCHQADYTATRNPPHAASGFPTTCQTCHTTTTWLGSPFNHSTTAFPLTGAHTAAACAACHGDGVYKGKPTACISCHQAKYNSAALPPHSSLGFSTVCTTCHTTAGWQPATFNHATTLFPLTGAHLAASCNDCHADKVYRGKPTTCVSCHQASYATTTNPPHAAAGFATTCQSCHTTTRWTGATFSHATTRFPLTGAHTSVACASCHGDGVYRGKTMVCSGCHQADYNATANPKHSTAGFPTTCEGCHNTTTWLGATFNHDASFFPIYSGSHKGKWTVCADCHTSSSNYAVFVCTSCHTKSKTDSQHQGRSGYVYQSSSCYSCHPRGRS